MCRTTGRNTAEGYADARPASSVAIAVNGADRYVRIHGTQRATPYESFRASRWASNVCPVKSRASLLPHQAGYLLLGEVHRLVRTAERHPPAGTAARWRP
jgi:hypothetical protein